MTSSWYVSSLQDGHLSIKWYDMNRNTSCKFVVLLHAPKMHLICIFSNYLSSVSHKHKWNTESLFTSYLDLYPCPVTLGHEPKWWNFDVLWQAIENEGFNQIKNFCSKLLHKNKFYYFSEKIWGVRCTIVLIIFLLYLRITNTLFCTATTLLIFWCP